MSSKNDARKGKDGEDGEDDGEDDSEDEGEDDFMDREGDGGGASFLSGGLRGRGPRFSFRNSAAVLFTLRRAATPSSSELKLPKKLRKHRHFFPGQLTSP